MFLDGVEFPKLPGKLPERLNSFQMALNFPYSLESYQMAWIFFPEGLECFQAWKVCIWPGKFEDGLESFHMGWTVCRWRGKVADGLESL